MLKRWSVATLYVFSGVRPSPGAATLGRELAIYFSPTLDNRELPVAEDGHTPLKKPYASTLQRCNAVTL